MSRVSGLYPKGSIRTGKDRRRPFPLRVLRINAVALRLADRRHAAYFDRARDAHYICVIRRDTVQVGAREGRNRSVAPQLERRWSGWRGLGHDDAAGPGRLAGRLRADGLPGRQLARATAGAAGQGLGGHGGPARAVAGGEGRGEDLTGPAAGSGQRARPVLGCSCGSTPSASPDGTRSPGAGSRMRSASHPVLKPERDSCPDSGAAARPPVPQTCPRPVRGQPYSNGQDRILPDTPGPLSAGNDSARTTGDQRPGQRPRIDHPGLPGDQRCATNGSNRKRASGASRAAPAVPVHVI